MKQEIKVVSPFGKHHGVHQDQLQKVNHRGRRRQEKRDNKQWEGKK